MRRERHWGVRGGNVRPQWRRARAVGARRDILEVWVLLGKGGEWPDFSSIC